MIKLDKTSNVLDGQHRLHAISSFGSLAKIGELDTPTRAAVRDCAHTFLDGLRTAVDSYFEGLDLIHYSTPNRTPKAIVRAAPSLITQRLSNPDKRHRRTENEMDDHKDRAKWALGKLRLDHGTKQLAGRAEILSLANSDACLMATNRGNTKSQYLMVAKDLSRPLALLVASKEVFRQGKRRAAKYRMTKRGGF